MTTAVQYKAYDAAENKTDLRGFLGAALEADWRQALIARGFGWHIQVGALTTPIVGGGAGTVLDLERPELAINCPAGYAMIPLRINVECQIGLQTVDAQENEIFIGMDRTQQQTAGTSTAEVATNMRTDITAPQPFTCFSAYTADGVATPLIVELIRKQAQSDLQGIAANFGGTIALPGFIQASVLAIPATLLTTLY